VRYYVPIRGLSQDHYRTSYRSDAEKKRINN
jgi:hypothetical protein